jgi:mRNA interferase RelE/StbE
VRTIVFEQSAARALDSLSPPVRLQIDEALTRLAITGSGSLDIKRLKGLPFLRLRCGDWRVIFSMSETKIAVVAVSHRSDVYRSM